MNKEGPNLEYLLRRLAETPADFLDDGVQVAAVVSDTLRALGGPPLNEGQAGWLRNGDARTLRNRMGITLISCWLLYDAHFREQAGLAEAALEFLKKCPEELAAVTPAGRFVSDPERREELARLCLKDLGMRPAGETLAQAQDRLNTLSSVERQRVMRAARAAEERANAIRQEMVRKARAEADAKAMRE